MTGRRLRAAATGFTLVELLLAVSILGIILTMLAGSFNVVAHGKTHAESRLAADQAGRGIIWQMSEELRGAVRTTIVPNHSLLVGSGHVQSGAPVDSLTLSTLGAGHQRSLFGFGTEDIVSYQAQPNPDHRGWFLLTRTQQSALLPQGSAAQPQPVVLADNVLALHIRYFNGQIWNESWDSRAQPGNMTLPFAVSINLEIAAPGGRPMDFSTQVLVPMAAQTR